MSTNQKLKSKRKRTNYKYVLTNSFDMKHNPAKVKGSTILGHMQDYKNPKTDIILLFAAIKLISWKQQRILPIFSIKPKRVKYQTIVQPAKRIWCISTDSDNRKINPNPWIWISNHSFFFFFSLLRIIIVDMQKLKSLAMIYKTMSRGGSFVKWTFFKFNRSPLWPECTSRWPVNPIKLKGLEETKKNQISYCLWFLVFYL